MTREYVRSMTMEQGLSKLFIDFDFRYLLKNLNLQETNKRRRILRSKYFLCIRSFNNRTRKINSKKFYGKIYHLDKNRDFLFYIWLRCIIFTTWRKANQKVWKHSHKFYSKSEILYSPLPFFLTHSKVILKYYEVTVLILSLFFLFRIFIKLNWVLIKNWLFLKKKNNC